VKLVEAAGSEHGLDGEAVRIAKAKAAAKNRIRFLGTAALLGL
jgi:hypothetical protein